MGGSRSSPMGEAVRRWRGGVGSAPTEAFIVFMQDPVAGKRRYCSFSEVSGEEHPSVDCSAIGEKP